MSKDLKNKSFLSELVSMLWEKKLWWLAPIVIILILFAVLLVLGQSSVISPFVYTIF
jgi:hypothetical protein